ncbi:MAG: HepT-like ribonuclease domain-containing protein [Bacteroidota bacterium]
MSKKENAVVLLMLEAIDKIFRYTNDLNTAKEFEQDIKSFDAVMMNFIALGGCVSKLSDNLKEQNQQIDWRKISSFRNVLAYHYFGILADEVWEIIKKNLPILKSDLEKICEV